MIYVLCYTTTTIPLLLYGHTHFYTHISIIYKNKGRRESRREDRREGRRRAGVKEGGVKDKRVKDK